MRAYLCGPMEHTPDNGASWRDRIVKDLQELEIIWLDPRDKPLGLGTEDLESRQRMFDARTQGHYTTLTLYMDQVRASDLRQTSSADFLVVHLDARIPTCGTWEEIINANWQNKPILIHYEQGKHRAPLWLFAMVPHETIFSSWDELYEYLRHIAWDPVIDGLGRWYFL
jgi:hypothetical protein